MQLITFNRQLRTATTHAIKAHLSTVTETFMAKYDPSLES